MTHIVKKKTELVYQAPSEFEGRSTGYTADFVVDETHGSVQMGFRMARLDAGGKTDAHVHSFEESVYVIDGVLTVDTPEGSYELGNGDYGLFPVGMTHAFRNTTGRIVDFAR